MCVPFLGTYTGLHYQKRLVRKEVKRAIMDGMGTEQLVLLRFTRAEADQKLRWEHSKEFEYDGQMYDVVYKAYCGDTTEYWCWWDHEESELERELDALLAGAFGNHPGAQKKHQQVIKLLKGLYYEDPEVWVATTPVAEKVTAPHYMERGHLVSMRPPSPPPPMA